MSNFSLVSGQKILTNLGWKSLSALSSAFIYVNPVRRSQNNKASAGINVSAAAAAAAKSISSIAVSAGGSGYTVAPTVSFSGGGGSGAAGTAVISGGAVTSITVTSKGEGYTSAPTAVLSGGDGTGATAGAVTMQATGVTGTITLTFVDGTSIVVSPKTKILVSLDETNNNTYWTTADAIDSTAISGVIYAVVYRSVQGDLHSGSAIKKVWGYAFKQITATATDATSGGLASHTFANNNALDPTEAVITGGVIVSF
jgi:hypothetical protein